MSAQADAGKAPAGPQTWVSYVGRVDGLPGLHLVIGVPDDPRRRIALISPVDAMDESDLKAAALIIAAPILLAKLEEIAGTCAECGGDGEIKYAPEAHRMVACPDCQDIRSVISLARGATLASTTPS